MALCQRHAESRHPASKVSCNTAGDGGCCGFACERAAAGSGTEGLEAVCNHLSSCGVLDNVREDLHGLHTHLTSLAGLHKTAAKGAARVQSGGRVAAADGFVISHLAVEADCAVAAVEAGAQGPKPCRTHSWRQVAITHTLKGALVLRMKNMCNNIQYKLFIGVRVSTVQ